MLLILIDIIYLSQHHIRKYRWKLDEAKKKFVLETPWWDTIVKNTVYTSLGVIIPHVIIQVANAPTDAERGIAYNKILNISSV